MEACGCGDLPEYIQFGTIKGDFSVSSCKLTTLRGMPKIVHGDFDCDDNELTSLEFAPKIVEGDFDCVNNKKKFKLEEVNKVCCVSARVIR